MPVENRSSVRWFRRYKEELIFLILLAGAAGGGAFYARHAEYVGGTENLPGRGFIAFVQIYGVLALTGLGFIIWQCVQLFRTPCSGRVAFLIVPPIILVGGFMIIPPLAPAFLRGFEQWVLREVDTDAIQQWLAAEGHKYVGWNLGSGHGFPEDFPDFLVRFKPSYISFHDSVPEGGLRVEFGWAGGWQAWRLVVGLPDMPMPKEGLSGDEYRRPIKPGVYIVEEGG